MGKFAYYIDQNGEYQWTDKPQDGWRLVEEPYAQGEGFPSPTPTPIPTPSPSPTPAPGPSPVDNQTNITYQENYPDGSYAVYNKYTGHELYRVNADGSVKVLNNKYWGKIVGNITESNITYDARTDTLTIKFDNPNSSYTNSYIIKNETLVEHRFGEDTINVEKYNPDGSIKYREEHRKGIITVYSPDKKKIKTIYEDGSYNVYDNDNTIQYDSNNKKLKTIFSDGSYETYEDNKAIKFDKDGNEYIHIYNDGRLAYINAYKEDLILYPDGTFYSVSNNKKGKYTIDDNGFINCADLENNIYKYDSKGIIQEKIDSEGNTTNYTYNYDKMSVTITTNNIQHSSKINHIEYDEDEYNKILLTMNNISDSYKEKIDSEITNIEGAISRFPDSYQGSEIRNISSGIGKSIEMIETLSKMTNYSLLAYQSCDSKLKDNLNNLIDSIFDNKKTGEQFKKSIGFTIEDRNNDGILEYKLETDYNNLFNNVIPTKVYIDENGNKLFFNNRGYLISSDGDNIKINYGGESFSLSYGKNGCVILRDSNGNPISIFGDYNLASRQYGGNQKDFYLDGATKLLKDDEINKILDRYFPGASTEEKMAYLNNIAAHGCGYVAMANYVMEKMEGYEEDFQNKFGYSMYNIAYKDNEISVDYNYEPLTLELFSESNGKDAYGNSKTIKEATKVGGMLCEDYLIDYYLETKYQISDYNVGKNTTMLRMYDYSMSDMDGNIESSRGGHAVTLTEELNGAMYVSSWGTKYCVNKLNGIGRYLYPLEHGVIFPSRDDSVEYEYNKRDGKIEFIIHELKK